MLGINNLKIGKKILVAPTIAMILLIVLAVFSNNALKSDKETLNVIVQEKFEIYKASSSLLIDVDLYNSILYKVFSYANGGYEQSQIDEQLNILNQIGETAKKDMKKLASLSSQVSAKEQKLLKEVEVNFNEYLLTVRDAIDMLSVDVGMATPMLSVTDEVFLQLNFQLDTLYRDADKEVRHSYEEAQSHIDATLGTLYVLIVLAIALSIAASVVVNNSIKKPLESFQTGLLDFFAYVNKEKDNTDIIKLNTKDELGEMADVVNENIAKVKDGLEKDRVVIDSAVYCAGEAKKGFLSARINGQTSNPSLNELKDVINGMLEAVENNIKSAMGVLAEYRENNYIPRANVTNIEGDLKALSEDVNSVGETITNMLVENKKSGMFLSQNANTLSLNMQNISRAANDQAARLEETAASLEQITSNISSNTETTAQMATYGNDVKVSVEKGQTLANNTTKAMEEINEQTSAINEAITVIDQIAFQTNILSLNAAVEAATAGEAGKGFAVVAQEVRNLAARSAEAAKEIKEIVETAQLKTEEGKKAALEMIDGYDELNGNITRTIELIENVTTASKEQSSGIIQINDAVNNLDKITQENAQSASEADAIASKTLEISNTIIEDADKKEFEGKDSIGIRRELTDLSYKGEEKRSSERQIKESPAFKQNEVITAQNSSDDDEWASF